MQGEFVPYPNIAHPYLSCSKATGFRNQSTAHFVLPYNEDYGGIRTAGKVTQIMESPLFYKKSKFTLCLIKLSDMNVYGGRVRVLGELHTLIWTRYRGGQAASCPDRFTFRWRVRRWKEWNIVGLDAVEKRKICLLLERLGIEPHFLVRPAIGQVHEFCLILSFMHFWHSAVCRFMKWSKLSAVRSRDSSFVWISVITTGSRVLPEKLTDCQIRKNSIHQLWYTKLRYCLLKTLLWSLAWARWIQSIPS